MAGVLRAAAAAAIVVVSCSSPQGPQGDPGPAGSAGPPGPGAPCTAPMTTCNGACVDPTNDSKNCGACGVVCTDRCTDGACCGDGKKNGGEACDKGDLGGATCATAAAPGWTGTPGCTAACKLDSKPCTTPATTWNDFTNASNWSVFDVSSVNGGARGFSGSVFDGRYFYLVPNYNGGQNGIVARYDTQAGFGTGASWSTFDVGSVYGGARGFSHGAFDGRYVYFVPNYNGGYDGIVARYDTQASFGAATSWSAFDISSLFSGARGYQGAVFDGRYLYLVPYYNGSSSGLVARYDTQGGFGFSGSWSAFDTTSINPNARGFLGATFDGRYVYFVPYNNGSPSSFVTRYDTQAPFGSAGAWVVFDMSTVNPGAKGYQGAGFDGRYVYFAPYYNGAYDGLVAQYDTQADFTAIASWATFDISAINGNAKGLVGATFDGRYMYFASYYNGGTQTGIVARYDTTVAFPTTPAWTIFDAQSVNGGSRGFQGSAFDGRYLYLVPYYNGGYDGLVTRLDAKSASWLPKGWSNAQY